MSKVMTRDYQAPPRPVEETRASLKAIFKARSVALVGASADPRKFGYMTLDSLVRGGYDGRIFP